MKKNRKTVLLIPSVRKGNGTGHMKRCAALAEKLQALGADTGILVDSAEARRHSCYNTEDVKKFLSGSRRKKPAILTDAVAADWDICIFDSRHAQLSRLNSFNGISMCIGIDEGGESRDYFDYLIDILPNLERNEPNISSTGFLNLPEAEIGRQPAEPVFQMENAKILITFGGEDENDLTGKFLSMIEDTGILSRAELTVVEGPLFKNPVRGNGFEVIKAPSNLGGMLGGWDLVITIFGLTCFEALHSGVPVLLFNPSGYHRSLSVRAGIPEIGVNHPDAGKLEDYLSNPARLYSAVKNYSGLARLDLASWIFGLPSEARNICRGCGRKHHKIIYRKPEISFFRCSNCGMVNQQYFGSNAMSYEEDYFFEDYKKQYGRTYLEDFNKIKQSGMQRCSIIGRLAKGGDLLDIGCGYGPFLSAAADSGYRVFGIDISKDAARYSRDELGFDTAAVPLEELDRETFGVERFDIISMWFVLEHIKAPAAALRKINSMLEPGGVLAFSTPNYDGITRRISVHSFLSANPVDHYAVWTPRTAGRLLRKYGFKLKYIRTPSVHPERYFRKQEFYFKLKPPIKKMIDGLIGCISRLFLLGDTFEVYAVKRHDR